VVKLSPDGSGSLNEFKRELEENSRSVTLFYYKSQYKIYHPLGRAETSA